MITTNKITIGSKSKVAFARAANEKCRLGPPSAGFTLQMIAVTTRKRMPVEDQELGQLKTAVEWSFESKSRDD